MADFDVSNVTDFLILFLAGIIAAVVVSLVARVTGGVV